MPALAHITTLAHGGELGVFVFLLLLAPMALIFGIVLPPLLLPARRRAPLPGLPQLPPPPSRRLWEQLLLALLSNTFGFACYAFGVFLYSQAFLPEEERCGLMVLMTFLFFAQEGAVYLLHELWCWLRHRLNARRARIHS